MIASVLLDTHAWGWSFYAPKRLSQRAVETIQTADQIWLSAASFYEMAQKARRGQWPEIEQRLDELPDILARQSIGLADVTGRVALKAGSLNWDHRDPFDRIIVATGQLLDLKLVTRDAALQSYPDITCIW